MLVLTFTILPFGVLVLLLADRWRQAAANERHAAWESFFSKKRAPRCMGALLAGTRRHQMFQKPSPRSMGIIFFQKNERHAAWERSCRSRAPKITQDKKMTFLHQKS